MEALVLATGAGLLAAERAVSMIRHNGADHQSLFQKWFQPENSEVARNVGRNLAQAS